jgi:hypothetical protein
VYVFAMSPPGEGTAITGAIVELPTMLLCPASTKVGGGMAGQQFAPTRRQQDEAVRMMRKIIGCLDPAARQEHGRAR